MGKTLANKLVELVADGAQKVGETILKKGTPQDLTGPGRAYTIYLKEAEANGDKPMTREEFEKFNKS
jgi:hypothetical protein